MPKLNLISGKRPSRYMSNQQNTVFYVSKKHERDVYYVREVDKDNKAVKWIKHRNRAIRFHTQRSVYQFLHAYMNDRTDIIIVNALEE